ncbi:MAG: hypothetical protein V4517_26920 [Pseudomonadota bacterium]
MNRKFVFLLAAPMLVAFTVSLICAGSGLHMGFPGLFAAAAFFFTLLVSLITLAFDGVLTRASPFVLRSPLTAIVGAMAASGLGAFLSEGRLPPSMLVSCAIAGAFCMGVCSIISKPDRGRERRLIAARVRRRSLRDDERPSR